MDKLLADCLHEARYFSLTELKKDQYIDLSQPKSVAPRPGCLEPDKANPGQSRILISISNFAVNLVLYIVWPSVLSFNNLYIHKTKQRKTFV